MIFKYIQICSNYKITHFEHFTRIFDIQILLNEDKYLSNFYLTRGTYYYFFRFIKYTSLFNPINHTNNDIFNKFSLYKNAYLVV